jgi:hypothetical protein
VTGPVPLLLKLTAKLFQCCGLRNARRRARLPVLHLWPDDFRDEVVARLLELNKQRAEQEVLAGAASLPQRGRRRRTKAGDPGPGLLGPD